MKALARCALTGTAERDARETPVRFTPTGTTPGIVTLIAAIVSNTNDGTRVCLLDGASARAAPIGLVLG